MGGDKTRATPERAIGHATGEGAGQVRLLGSTNGYPVAIRLHEIDTWRRNHG